MWYLFSVNQTSLMFSSKVNYMFCNKYLFSCAAHINFLIFDDVHFAYYKGIFKPDSIILLVLHWYIRNIFNILYTTLVCYAHTKKHLITINFKICDGRTVHTSVRIHTSWLLLIYFFSCRVLKKDPYHSTCLPVHIACLVELKKTNSKLIYLILNVNCQNLGKVGIKYKCKRF